jgi:hypothetical protein
MLLFPQDSSNSFHNNLVSCSSDFCYFSGQFIAIQQHCLTEFRSDSQKICKRKGAILVAVVYLQKLCQRRLFCVLKLCKAFHWITEHSFTEDYAHWHSGHKVLIKTLSHCTVYCPNAPQQSNTTCYLSFSTSSFDCLFLRYHMLQSVSILGIMLWGLALLMFGNKRNKRDLRQALLRFPSTYHNPRMSRIEDANWAAAWSLGLDEETTSGLARALGLIHVLQVYTSCMVRT